MSQIVGESNIMEWRPQHHSGKSADISRNIGNVSNAGQQVADQRVPTPPLARLTPCHKSLRQAFLNWVAFKRSFAPNIKEIERRTCPLVKCEICFICLDDMLEHVKDCPRLSQGWYRCFESGKEERIGRCDSQRCQELQQYKDRIVNSIRRRLSPRVSGSRRLLDIPLEMQKLSPEMSHLDSALNESYTVGIAELSCEATISPLELDTNWKLDTAELGLPPAYTPTYFISAQASLAELGSGYESTYTAQRPLQSQYRLAELDIGHGSSDYLKYLKERKPKPAELGANDNLTYLAQHFAQCRYGPAELSTDNTLSYPASRPNLALQQRSNPGFSASLDSLERLNNWRQEILSPNASWPIADPVDFDHSAPEKLENIDTPASNSLNEAILPVSQYSYPVSQAESSTTGRGTSGDDTSGNSWFSTPSTLSSWDTSLSSLESNNPTREDFPKPSCVFFEPNLMFSEPEDMGLSLLASYDLAGHLSNTSSNLDNRLDDVTFVKDHRPFPPQYFTNVSPQEDTQYQDQFQIPRKPVPLSTPGVDRSPQDLTPVIKCSPQDHTSAPNPARPTPVSPRAEHACIHCCRTFNDKSNLKRHEVICKRNPLKNVTKPYMCTYPRCGRSFTRSDGLLVHQRGKSHEKKFELVIENLLLHP